MAQKYAVIKNSIVTNIIISEDNLSNDSIILIPENIDCRINWSYDGTNFIVPPSQIVVTLESFKSSKINELNDKCKNAIISGFSSNALGSNYNYPSSLTDQQNLTASVVASLMPNLDPDWTTPFWCEDSNSNWSFVNHSASQIQKVGQDGKNAILSAMNKLQVLTVQVNNCASITQVRGISW